jgi:hypothetical protein
MSRGGHNTPGGGAADCGQRLRRIKITTDAYFNAAPELLGAIVDASTSTRFTAVGEEIVKAMRSRWRRSPPMDR